MKQLECKYNVNLQNKYFSQLLFLEIQYFFFWIRGNLIPRKAYFVGSVEGVKPRLS